jgi:hypothetical protein
VAWWIILGSLQIASPFFAWRTLQRFGAQDVLTSPEFLAMFAVGAALGIVVIALAVLVGRGSIRAFRAAVAVALLLFVADLAYGFHGVNWITHPLTGLLLWRAMPIKAQI